MYEYEWRFWGLKGGSQIDVNDTFKKNCITRKIEYGVKCIRYLGRDGTVLKRYLGQDGNVSMMYLGLVGKDFMG